jgi:hypothetical protein
MTIEKIQRAWRRTRGMGFAGRRLKEAYPFFTLLRENKLSDPCVLLSPGLLGYFVCWVRKLLIRGGSPDEEVEFITANPDIMACWVVVLHVRNFSSEVADLSETLADSFLQLLDEQYGAIRSLASDMKTFASAYSEWRMMYSVSLLGGLRLTLTEKLNYALRSGRMTDPFVHSMIDFQSLHALFCMVDRNIQGFVRSNVCKALLVASKNPCKVVGVHVAKAMHDLILNKDHVIHIDQSTPQLSTRNTVNGRIVDSKGLRNDMMSVMVGFVDDAAVLEEIADAFYETQNSPAFAAEIFEVLMKIAMETPIASEIRSAWESGKEGSPLEALVYAIRMMQNLIDNKNIESARLIMAMDINPTSLTRQTWATMQITQKSQTCAWVRDLIQTKCSCQRISAMAASNPYALIEFLDTALVRLVLDSVPDVDYLAQDRLPEFLVHDHDRLTLLRSELSTHPVQPEDFLELVNAREWMGPSPCPLAVLHAAKLLRSMLDLCRFCHGQMLNAVVVGIAKDVVITL